MTIRTLAAGATGAALLAVAAGCGRPLPADKEGARHGARDVVARANGHQLRWSDCDKRARAELQQEVTTKLILIPKENEEKALQFFRRKAVVLFVNKHLMLDEAKRRGLTVSATERSEAMKQFEELLQKRGIGSIDEFVKKSPLGPEATRRELEDDLRVDKLIKTAITGKITISDAEREARARDAATRRGEARRRVEALRLQVVKGADFAALARQHSEDEATRNRGGDLGDIVRGRAEKQIEDAAFGLRVNEVSQVLEVQRRGISRTESCFVLVKATGRTPAKPAAGTAPAVPESVRASVILVRTDPTMTSREIDEDIRARKYKEGLAALLGELRSKAKIDTIYKDVLKTLKPGAPEA
jgi:parvulin-like peptidyl-prolyl isomerase